MMRTFFFTLLLTSIAAFGADRDRAKWLSVADKLITTNPESYAWDWGEGVEMSGLMQVWERTKDDRYAAWVARWADFHVPRGLDVLLGNNADSPRKGYCGRWVAGTALLYLNEARPKPEYLKTASEVAQFIRAGATRSPEGAPAHWFGNFQIWVDTLNMTCPLLSKLSKIENQPEYLEDCVNQLLVSARHMQDEKTLLFYHMWDWQYDKRSAVQWGRGNGWIIMSLADTFEYLPKNHRLYKPLKQMAEKHARGLLAAQDKDGVWHTVMNDPTSYAECSATAMTVYGWLRLVRLGVLPTRYRAAALRAWAATNERWVKDGMVAGVSAGTNPSDKDGYFTRPQGAYTWGTGAYLLAGAEVDRMR